MIAGLRQLLALLRRPPARMALSIAVPTGMYGVSFGALGVASGLDGWQTMALSLLMFTGGSQFAFIGVVGGGGGGAAALAAASLLGVRNAVYAVQINHLLQPRGWRRFLAAQLTIDESTATALAQGDRPARGLAFWVAGLGIFLLWNLFTLLGVWLGDALGDPRLWGLDGAVVAAFLALLWPRLGSRGATLQAIACAVAAALTLPWLPVGMPILVAAAVAAVWAWPAPRQGATR